MKWFALCSLLAFTGLASHAPAPHQLNRRDDIDPALLYPEHNISVPVDHFLNESKYEPHTNATFNLRYWFDKTYYKPGGPVIVLQGGETDGSGRLPYLQKGIVAQLSQATGGLGVILEHRFYGQSFPTDDLSTENLRYLTTAQALADQAYFATNVVFKGVDADLRAPNTAWIAYGGSYAGGFVAFLRKLYPEIFWGAIASSAVTEAIYDYWEYYEPIREYGPAHCIANQQKLTNVVDNILMKNDSATRGMLKSAFVMQDLTYDDDFANVLSYGIGGWQGRNWDPAVNDFDFSYYCSNITSQKTLWPGTSALSANASALIEAGGWGNESDSLTVPMLNYIGWINDSYVASYEGELDLCYNSNNASADIYTDKSLENYGSLSWAYQYCTEWGYIQTGSGVPNAPPDVGVINQYGGFNISYPRLAHIGGETDPWRPATPLVTKNVPTQLNRTSTADEPVILIQGGVHHWDENGLFPNETTAELPPPPVADAQKQMAQFVQLWMSEWKKHCINEPGSCA